ncbi:MAG: hypothetical protein Q7R41_12965 [Phycisphaerales bacterium]|nr:hypothetical protein [Phycisphaerales bacterium]
MPEVINKKVVAIEYPRHEETITSNDYTFRVCAMSGVKAVEVSINEAGWQPCRQGGDSYWYDWSGYGAGDHAITARVTLSDGRQHLTDHRFFSVDLPNAGERRMLTPRQTRQYLSRTETHRNMVNKFVVMVPNQPAVLRQLTSLLSHEGYNIESVLMETAGEVASFRFLVENETEKGIRRELEKEGFHIVTDKAFRLDLPNRPGELDRLTRKLLEQGVAIRYLYGTSHGQTTKVVFSVDRPEDAERVVKELDQRTAALAA